MYEHSKKKEKSHLYYDMIISTLNFKNVVL